MECKVQVNKCATAVGLLALGLTWAADAAEPEPILWSVTPYVWFTDTEYGLEADGSEIGGGTVTANDLFDSLDVAGQVVIEAGRSGGHFSAFVDATYLKTSDDENGFVEGLGQLRFEAESEQWLIDAAVSYWPLDIDRGGRLYLGVRYTDLNDETTLDSLDHGEQLAKIELERDYTDLLMGGSYKHDLGNRWSLHTKADYAYADSDGIFQAQLYVMYKLRNRPHGLIAGYRYKEAGFEHNGIEEDYEYQGPFVAFNLRF
jgi:hypothetical protein